ncbi:MAG: gliding motility protein GldC [Chitinophagaceae bacterium]|jgi:gliding motility-associated protein GldC
MNTSTISIDVTLDQDKIPEHLSWNATQSSAEAPQDAKAMMLSFWDGREKAAMRIDLWTKDMMVDEMGDFVYQNMMSMADNFERATRQAELARDMKIFAKAFLKKFQQNMEKQSQNPQ